MSNLKNFTAGAREIHAAKSAFFAGGFLVSTWAPMIPFVKERLAVGSDVLGLLLLTIGLAAFLFMPVAGIFTRHLGCRRVIMAATFVMAAAVLVIPVLPSLWTYFVVLFIFGAGMGSLDVTMNLHAVVVERIAARRILSGMHGFWSIGCFVGSGLFTVLAKCGLSVLAVVSVHIALLLALCLYFYGKLIPFRGDSGQKALTWPRGLIAVLCGLTFISFLAEGAVMDWSGVLLSETKHLDLAAAGIGFSIYSAAMLICRLIGDRVVSAFGEKRILLLGSLIGAVGFVAVDVMPTLMTSLPFFFVIGIGLANIVPVFYTLAARQNEIPLDTAVSVMTAVGYSGVIMGPSALGFLAEHAGIVSVFYGLAALLLLQAILIFRFIKK